MSYLLFVRAASDLERACREVSDYFAFQRRQAGPGPQTLHGIWIEPNTLSFLPVRLVSPPWRPNGEAMPLGESFGVSGIWELARVQVPPAVLPARDFPDAIIESLRGLASGQVGLFAPVFASDLVAEAVNGELIRLRQRYPGALAPPLLQDPDNGVLEYAAGRH